jgi:hypothetical protein
VREGIYTSNEGRSYQSRSPMDYHGRTYYVGEITPTRYDHLSPITDRYARDLDGTPLTHRTPAGPTFEEAFRKDIEKLDAERAEYERLRTKFEGAGA